MSDEPLAMGAVPLDGPDFESQEGATITGITPGETAPADDPDDAEPEGTVAGEGGTKLVPLAAVREARRIAKESKASLATLQAELEAARQKAAKFDELHTYVDQARPIIEAVRSRPDLVKAAKEPPPAAKAGPLSEADAVEFAKDLDLYKSDGTPDVDRAQRLAARQAALSEQSARTLMQPLHEREMAHASQQMKARVAAFKDKNGQSVDPKVLEEIWSIVPPELSSKQEVAAILHRVAVAEMVMRGQYQGGGPPPPVMTEGLGASAPAGRTLTDIDEKFRRAADIDRNSFAATAGKYRPGAVNALE